MVRLRLRRVGAKAQPSYRIIAAEKEAPRDGGFLEILGSYNPRTHPATIEVAEARVYDWLSKGAQPSESVVQVFNSIGLMGRFERFKKGEEMEILMAESQKAMSEQNINPKTERAPAPKKSKAA